MKTNKDNSTVFPPDQLHLEIMQTSAYISCLQVRKELLSTWEDTLLRKLFRSNRKHSVCVCNFHM